MLNQRVIIAVPMHRELGPWRAMDNVLSAVPATARALPAARGAGIAERGALNGAAGRQHKLWGLLRYCTPETPASQPWRSPDNVHRKSARCCMGRGGQSPAVPPRRPVRREVGQTQPTRAGTDFDCNGRCPTLPEQRGSSTAPRCCTRVLRDMTRPFAVAKAGHRISDLVRREKFHV